MFTEERVWLGALRLNATWIWISGRCEIGSFTVWHNDGLMSPSSTQALNLKQGTWRQRTPDTLNSFICEY